MKNILDYLEQAAERFPQKTAFSDENGSVTFSVLCNKAKETGTAIATMLGSVRLPVAVLSHHTVSDITAFLGTLYAGCFYVPIDANAPEDYRRKRFESIPPALIIDAEPPEAEIDEKLLVSIRRQIISSDPAYAIFTSGSTGKPKGAVVSHYALLDFLDWLTETFGFNEDTVFGNQNMFYFDASVTEIYSVLKCGATMHILPKKMFISPLRVVKTLDDLKITVIPWATAAVKLLANSGVFEKYAPKYLTDVIFGGENMPTKQLNVWRRAIPNARYANVYGPTETTVDCSYYFVERNFADGESVPIGYACGNKQLFLLNDGVCPPVGESGELFVRGVGVGLGYYGEPELTGKAFMQNPLNPYYRDIVYRTGDIAKINEYGELVYLSRADGQVKHMGNRIELGEIESVAAAVAGIELVCCAYDYDNSKLLMFYQGCGQSKDISVVLAERLPRYMQPNTIINVPKMPETPNGKIDRISVKKEYYEKG